MPYCVVKLNRNKIHIRIIWGYEPRSKCVRNPLDCVGDVDGSVEMWVAHWKCGWLIGDVDGSLEMWMAHWRCEWLFGDVGGSFNKCGWLIGDVDGSLEMWMAHLRCGWLIGDVDCLMEMFVVHYYH